MIWVGKLVHKNPLFWPCEEKQRSPVFLGLDFRHLTTCITTSVYSERQMLSVFTYVRSTKHRFLVLKVCKECRQEERECGDGFRGAIGQEGWL